MIIITGSKALNRRLGFTHRTSKDIDIIARPDDVDAFVKTYGTYTTRWNISNNKRVYVFGMRSDPKLIIEVELALPDTNQEQLLSLIEAKYSNDSSDIYYADLDLLYMLKMSHRFLKNSPHFEKTFNDIKLLRDHNAAMNLYYMDWYARRVKDTYTYLHPKLNQTKKDFFSDDGVQYVYDHDSIHAVVKCGEKPAYTYFKHPNEDVLCSRELFDSSDESIKLNAVLEESYVLALERSQIPFKDTVAPEKSFKIALQKVCSSITSGWFRDYAWENYDTVLSMYNSNYVLKFWNAVNNNEVKEIEYDQR